MKNKNGLADGSLRHDWKFCRVGGFHQVCLETGADLAALARSWPRLDSLRKLLLFKLLAAPRALELYGRLPFREKYFLFCGFPISVIAPILEDAPPALRRAFVQLPAKFGDLMRQDLLRDAGKGSA